MSHFSSLCSHVETGGIFISEGCSIFETSGQQVLGMSDVGRGVVAVVLFGWKQC